MFLVMFLVILNNNRNDTIDCHTAVHLRSRPTLILPSQRNLITLTLRYYVRPGLVVREVRKFRGAPPVQPYLSVNGTHANAKQKYSIAHLPTPTGQVRRLSDDPFSFNNSLMLPKQLQPQEQINFISYTLINTSYSPGPV